MNARLSGRVTSVVTRGMSRGDATERTGWSAKSRPPRATLPAQQRAFDAFRREYNEVRPHDTLAGHTPASVYRPSLGEYPRRLPAIDYPGHYLMKRITSGGTFRFGRRLFFLATPLEGTDVGLDEVEDGIWSIYFCHVLIARFNERDSIIRS